MTYTRDSMKFFTKKITLCLTPFPDDCRYDMFFDVARLLFPKIDTYPDMDKNIPSEVQFNYSLPDYEGSVVSLLCFSLEPEEFEFVSGWGTQI